MYPMIATAPPPPQHSSPEICTQGHRSALILPTNEGGSICLLCLSNLLSSPKSPTVHVSYALSQFSQAISQPQFLKSLLTFHSHFLISPLVSLLSNFDDEPIAKQTIDLIVKLCDASNNNGNDDVCKQFVARVSECISLGSMAWSCRQLYMLHCFGVLLDYQESNLYASIKNKDSLILNLVTGLQLSSEEIQGEIMFVLYKCSLLQCTYMDDSSGDVLFANCPKLLRLSLDVLMKSQNDDVRLNCVAFLTVLARRGFFQTTCESHLGNRESCEADNFMQIPEEVRDGPPLEVLFAEAVKGPLLSSDSQLQEATLDLIFLYVSPEDVKRNEIQVLVEENVADYIYEILRLSGCKDPIIHSSVQVLDIFSTAEQSFRPRLAIGFSTLIPILHHVAGVPFHPVQCQLLKLILNSVSNCPGIVSSSHVDEISTTLSEMFKKNIDGDVGMLPESFTLSCSIFVALMKCSSSHESSSLAASIADASRSAFSTCLGKNHPNSDQILHALYLLKEACAYVHQNGSSSSNDAGLKVCIINICKIQILPWFVKVINDIDEETLALGVIETFHSILHQVSIIEVKNLADSLASSNWFSILFGCLGLFPSKSMKWRVYTIFSSIVDAVLGNDSGQPIMDTALHLPSDPSDLLFLLGQKSSHDVELLSCQSAVLLILHVSSLYGDRIADDRLILASLEQYILLNSCNFPFGASNRATIEFLINLYGLYRGFAKMSYQIPYSPEAERILFHLMAENDWDLLSTRIHLTSLRWLFQQEKLCQLLSEQTLNFCRLNSSNGNLTVVHHETSQKVDLNVFAQLIESGDNFAATIFVCLLDNVVENAGGEDDIISVVKTLTKLIDISPVASDRLCMHGIENVLQTIYHHSKYSFPELFMETPHLVFSILRSVQSESMSNTEAWVGIAMKLVDYLIPVVASDGWNEEVLTTIGILSLILHHSTHQTLAEASKTILLNASLASKLSIAIYEACSKGPALFDHDEGTRTGEVLIFMLLLLFLSVRSVRAIVPDIIDLRILLDEGGEMQPLSYISIQCQNLCKLLHFGSPPVKLITSFCLLEQFRGISDYISREQVDLKLRPGYILSVSAVLEALIFSNDVRVSLNCSRCLSTLVTWEGLNTESKASKKNNWGRLIVEELVMLLSAPSLTSNLFAIHHKPATIFAIALLKRSKVPSWMSNVFDDSSITRIIQNMSPSNISTDLVLLFRELLNSGYLNSAHLVDLNRVFQACRRQIYANEIQDASLEKYTENEAELDRVGKARVFLVRLMSGVSLERSQCVKEALLEEIELFTKCLMEEDG